MPKRSGPAGKLQTTIPLADFLRFEQACEREHVSMASVLRRACYTWLAEHPTEAPVPAGQTHLPMGGHDGTSQ